jgi:hypothetical protein
MLRRIGLSEAARRAITLAERIDNMTVLGRKETTELNSICKALRRPGGQVERHHVDGTVMLVNDPGIAISGTAAEHRLCMVAYIIRERRYISRTTDPNEVTLDYIYDWEDLQEAKDSFNKITTTRRSQTFTRIGPRLLTLWICTLAKDSRRS